MPSGVHNCFMVINTLIYLIFKPLLKIVAGTDVLLLAAKLAV